MGLVAQPIPPMTYQQQLQEYLRQAGVGGPGQPYVAPQQYTVTQGSGGNTVGALPVIGANVALREGIGALGSSSGTTAALTPASNAAWNAGAEAAASQAATGGAEAGAGLGSSLGTILPGAAVAAYYGPSYYKYAKALAKGPKEDDLLKGAMLTNPITAWAVPIADKLGLGIKAGKHKDQIMRDKVRSYLQENGVIDKGFNLTLADGRKFDIGVDGGSRPYNVDFTRTGAGAAVGLANPLAEIFTAGNPKLRSDFAGYLTNAIMSGGDTRANIKAQYDRAGISQQGAYDALQKLKDEGKFDAATLAAYQNGVNQAFDNGGLSGSKTSVIALKPAAPISNLPGVIAAVSGLPRSGTSSPGIDKSGKRISYGRKK